MKKIPYIILFFFCFQFLFSQDQLFKKDNTKLQVKILEITPKEIKYKLFNNLEGPLYTIDKKEVALIIYPNGNHEVITSSEPEVAKNSAPAFYMDTFLVAKRLQREKYIKEVTRSKNGIFFNTVEMAYSCLGFDYVHEFLNNAIQLHVPLSFSIDKSNINYNGVLGINSADGTYNYRIDKKAFDMGLGIYINTSGKKAFSHFIGPLFRFVQLNGGYDVYKNSQYYYYNNSYYPNNADHYDFVLNQTYVMINNGFMYRVTPQFGIMINVAVGFVTTKQYKANDPIAFKTNPYSNNTNTMQAGQFGFCFGYRF